jgi:hypothetical protein
MPTDFLEQLAELDVPPPPVAFNEDLHKRLNRSLTTQFIIDLGLNALPSAAIEFVRAILGMLTLTIVGKFPDKKNEGR